MKKMFLMALLVALIAGVSTTTAFAQRGAGSKLNGNFGHGFWHHNAAPAYQAAVNFQATPAVESNRSFSYEPAASATTNADNAAPVQDDAAVTQRFSYEPAQVVPATSYRSVDHHKPSYMYPKTDSRRWHH